VPSAALLVHFTACCYAANLVVMQEWRRGKFSQQQKEGQPDAKEA